MTTDIVILAAGQGSRMKSQLPKVLHSIGNKPMVQHVIDSAKQIEGVTNLHVVIGHGAEKVEEVLTNEQLSFSLQKEQLGTGHAVAQAMPKLASESVCLVLYGDVPLVKPSTMQNLVTKAESGDLGLLTVHLDNPSGYGRIVRNEKGDVVAIVEQKDANTEQLSICEVNTGIMAIPTRLLKDWLPQLSSDNAQGEYYLTDIIAMASEQGVKINSLQAETEQEVQGVNNKLQLAELERHYQFLLAEELMTNGATLADPSRVDIRGEVELGQDVIIDVNVVLEGSIALGDNVVIEPNCVLKNVKIESGTRIKAFSHLEDTVIDSNCDIGPYARLRPGTQLAAGSKIGNFVETKKAIIGEGSKVNHLSYIGDAVVGANTNIGAGTITCNYDGVNKSTTEIGDDAFIGSNTALVAPVSIGNGATVGAGSTVTKAVADNALAVARGKQTILPNWQRPTKK